ncbi:MAG: hypothetical protein ABH830_03975 [Patescibacteria group bacterium]
MKKNILIFLSMVFLLTVSGCSLNGQNGGGNKNGAGSGGVENKQQNQEQTNNQNKMQRWQENFDEASSTEIVIGSKILVMGDENSDGSIIADRIIIGGGEMNMQELGVVMGEKQQIREKIRNITGDNNGTLRERPDFQNMSDEERTKMREQMQEKGITRGTTGERTDGAKITRLNGEIIAKDAESITIKLDSGGSKLIFLSSSTAFMKAKVQKTGSKN